MKRCDCHFACKGKSYCRLNTGRAPETEEKTMDYQEEKLSQHAASLGVASNRAYANSAGNLSPVRENIPSAHLLGQVTEAIGMSVADLEEAVDALLCGLGMPMPPHGETSRGGPEPVPSDVLDGVSRTLAARCQRIQNATGRLRALRVQLVG